MSYFDDVVSPVRTVNIPPMPTTDEVNAMVARVEQRAYNAIENDSLKAIVENAIVDPYADVSPNDSDLWWTLCTRAEGIGENNELAHLLWYIRGCGTRLVKDRRWGYILRPDIQKDGWETWEQWERDKHILDKYGKDIARLLRELN